MCIALYKCNNHSKRLDEYRLVYFERKVAKSMKRVQVESLPPPEEAAREHFFSVHHQICAWKGYKFSPIEWGWQWQGDSLQPVRCRKPPASAKILAHIFCNFKKGCGRECGCRKAGLKCSTMCSNCYTD